MLHPLTRVSSNIGSLVRRARRFARREPRARRKATDLSLGPVFCAFCGCSSGSTSAARGTAGSSPQWTPSSVSVHSLAAISLNDADRHAARSQGGRGEPLDSAPRLIALPAVVPLRVLDAEKGQPHASARASLRHLPCPRRGHCRESDADSNLGEPGVTPRYLGPAASMAERRVLGVPLRSMLDLPPRLTSPAGL